MISNSRATIRSTELRRGSSVERYGAGVAEGEQVNLIYDGKSSQRKTLAGLLNILQERSAKDASVIKVLKIISLIYLPSTIFTVSLPPSQQVQI